MTSSANHLTLGHIHYLNCVPFFGALSQQGFQGKLVSGVPSELNRMLQQGQLDASPSSSFEYARNWRDYLLLPGHSISSIGRVDSVLLFSPVEPAQLHGQSIAITGESATSINLLRIILRDFYRLDDASDYIPAGSVEELIRQNQPALLIGDRALKQATAPPSGMRIYDLGDIWHQHTGLPFVFALWMIRKQALGRHGDELANLGAQLQASRDQILGDPNQFAMSAAKRADLPVEKVISYWNTVDYDLDEKHLNGLQLFFDMCVKNGLLKEAPEMIFYSG